MKKVQLFAAGLSFLLSMIIISVSANPGGSYSCNVIYGDNIDYPVAGVEVNLYDNNDYHIGTTITGEDGYFTFDDLLDGASYTAKFSYDAEVENVDLEDAYTLLMYLFGYVELSEIKLLAGDVDANSQIDFVDFWYILYYYFVNDVSFPAGDWVLPDWVFTMDSGKQMGGPASVASLGDLTQGGQNKSNLNIQLDYNDLVLFNETDLIIPIYFNETTSTNGVGLVLGYNEELIDIVSIESRIEELNYSVKDGVIRIGWTDVETSYLFNQDEPVVEIHIKQNLALSNGQIEKFELLKGTHILNKSGIKYPSVSFTSSEFKLSSNNGFSTINETAYPNPCSDSFTVILQGEETNRADVQIFNTLGQLVKSETHQILNQELIINTQDLNAGIYIYHINIQSKLVTGTVSIQK